MAGGPGDQTATSCSPWPPQAHQRRRGIWLVSAATIRRGGLPGRHQAIEQRAIRFAEIARSRASPSCRLVVAWLPTRAARRRHQSAAGSNRSGQLLQARWRGGTAQLADRLSPGLQRLGGEAWPGPWAVRRTRSKLATAIPGPPQGKTLLLGHGPQALVLVRSRASVCPGPAPDGCARGSAPGFPPGASQIGAGRRCRRTALQHHHPVPPPRARARLTEGLRRLPHLCHRAWSG